MIEKKLVSLNIADITLREHSEIVPSREKLSNEQVAEFCDQLANLALEQVHLHSLLNQEADLVVERREQEGLQEKNEKPTLEKELAAIEQEELAAIANLEAERREEERLQRKGEKRSLEEELAAIAEGGAVQAIREKPEELVHELSDRLTIVQTQIKTLVAYPQVVERYREKFAKKVRIIQKAREIEYLRKRVESLSQANAELILRRQEKGFSQPDEEFLSRNNKRIAAAKARIITLEKNPELLVEEKRRELTKFRRQLKKGFVETPQIEELVNKLAARVRQGKPILLWGHTGTGKTETARYVSRKLFGADPKLFSGSEDATHYDLLGKTQLGPNGSHFEDGPATKALREGIPLLIDEIDLVPHSIIGRIQDLLTRRPGDTITIQENGDEEILIPKGFIVMATGNIRSRKYFREKLDPAFLRRYWQTEVTYLPLNETHDILLAGLIDRQGALRIGNRQTDLEDLKNFCQAAKLVQDVFTGEKTDFMGEGADASRGIGASLEKATLSIGDLLDIIKAWKAEDFTRPLEDFILSEFIQSQTVRQDQSNLVKIFCLHGFFKKKKAKDLGIPGLTEEKLLAYRGETV